MTDVERTCRELGWVSCAEMALQTLSARELAFKTLNEVVWDEFINDIQRGQELQYFNSNDGEFDGAKTWEALALSNGIVAVSGDFRLPIGLTVRVEALAMAIRDYVLSDNPRSTGCGCQAFWDPGQYARHMRIEVSPKLQMVIMHDGGSLAPYFNASYEDMKAYRGMADLIGRYGFWTESINPAVTHVYAKA